MTDLHVVIPTHRSESPLARLLQALSTHEPGASVVVVDDATPYGPPAVPEPIRLIASTDNAGFGAACNRGASAAPASAAYLVFLNPDVHLQADSLTQLADQLRARPRVGIATGPVVDADGVRVPSAWGRPSALRALVFAAGWRLSWVRAVLGRRSRTNHGLSTASTTTQELLVDGHVLGGAMVARRSCFEELGGFDEDFFLFWEDADLCTRARAAGWDVAVLPCTPIVHVEGTSSEGVTAEQRWRWYLAGARTYARKHLTSWRARWLLWALQLGRRIRRRR